jgi:hypothetical protein
MKAVVGKNGQHENDGMWDMAKKKRSYKEALVSC